MSKTDSMAHMDPATYVKFRDLQDRADAAEARLSRIAGIIEHVDRLRIESDEPSISTVEKMAQAELSEIYEAATLDRPVVDPLQMEATQKLIEIVGAVDSGNLEMNSTEIDVGDPDIPPHPWHEEWLHLVRALLAKPVEALKPERKPNAI